MEEIVMTHEEKQAEQLGKDHKRIYDVLFALDRYWYRHPYLRLGQIVSNAWQVLPEYKRDPEPEIQDIFYMPDDRFLAGLQKLEENERNSKNPTQI